MRFLSRFFARKDSISISPSGPKGKYENLAEDYRVTPESLTKYEHVTACLPLPVCLIDRKGFIQHLNEEFLAVVVIPNSEDFPYFGRFLTNESCSEFRRILDLLSEAKKKSTFALNFEWNSSYLKDESLHLDFLWTISGGYSNPVYLIIAR